MSSKKKTRLKIKQEKLRDTERDRVLSEPKFTHNNNKTINTNNTKEALLCIT